MGPMGPIGAQWAPLGPMGPIGPNGALWAQKGPLGPRARPGPMGPARALPVVVFFFSRKSHFWFKQVPSRLGLFFIYREYNFEKHWFGNCLNTSEYIIFDVATFLDGFRETFFFDILGARWGTTPGDLRMPSGFLHFYDIIGIYIGVYIEYIPLNI